MDEREATAEMATTAADAGGPQQQLEKPAGAASDQPLAVEAEPAAAASAVGGTPNAATGAAATARAAAEAMSALEATAAATADPSADAGQSFQRG